MGASCLNFAVFMLLGLVPTDSGSPEYKGQPFNEVTRIYGRDVTCANYVIGVNEVFPADTWICKDLKVDGRRLRVLTVPQMGVNNNCKEDIHDANSSRKDNRNDIAALCRELMKTHGDLRPLWAAMMMEATCDKTNTSRLLYRPDSSGLKSWEDFRPGNGYLVTLHCMGLPRD